jgi:hypothetical protein
MTEEINGVRVLRYGWEVLSPNVQTDVGGYATHSLDRVEQPHPWDQIANCRQAGDAVAFRGAARLKAPAIYAARNNGRGEIVEPSDFPTTVFAQHHDNVCSLQSLPLDCHV